MRKLAALSATLGIAACAFAASALNGPSTSSGVQVTRDDVDLRIDITIDGAPFTSYIWPTSLKKPVLFPIITDDGITVTRGYPLDPGAGERVDHPHHAGLW